MYKLTFSTVSFTDIKKCVDIETIATKSKAWCNLDRINLKKSELAEIKMIQSHLKPFSLYLMNEATIWGRAIYPLLLLAESRIIQVGASVVLKTAYKNFALEGRADAIFARNVAGYLEAPYFIVVETKRGIEAKNPIPQLYAELLASAMLNQKQQTKDIQRIFGCYTIVDSWVFIQADVLKIEDKRPILKIITSREYNEKYEAVTILKIIKNILNITTSD